MCPHSWAGPRRTDFLAHNLLVSQAIRHFLPSLLLLLAFLSGCGPLVDPDQAWAEVGAGWDEFQTVEDGAIFSVEKGAQGGMHIWVSARTYAIDPGPLEMWQGLVDGSLPLVRFQIASPEGVLTEDIERPYVLERLGESHYVLLQNLVQFDHFPELPENWQELNWGEVEEAMEAMDITLSVRFTDAQGTVVEDTRSIRLDFSETQGDEVG